MPDQNQPPTLPEEPGLPEEGGSIPFQPGESEILEEIHKLQNKSSNGGTSAIILIVSIVLFLALGSMAWNWKNVVWLIPILLVHELGHFLAMKMFNYRNVQMFFIPLLGAAVSGRNYNIPGWKKAIVSLAGPLPGIVIALGLGVGGIRGGHDWMLQAAVLTLIINAFNLLPLLPLDGGWVVHTILFCRNPILDVCFRAMAALGLVALSAALSAKLLMFVGIFTAIGIPPAWKLAQISERLRRQGINQLSPDDQTLPLETARAIISELRVAFPKGTNNRGLAQFTLSIFESLNAQPPNLLASLSLLGIQTVSLAASIVAVIFFMVAQQGDLQNMVSLFQDKLENTYQCDTLERAPIRRSTPENDLPHDTIIATFENQKSAHESFDALRPDLGDHARMLLFGQSILLSVPSTLPDERKTWVDRFDALSEDVIVHTPSFNPGFNLVCVVSDAEAAAKLDREFQQYLALTLPPPHLIPPWHPADPRSPQEAAAQNKARATFAILDGVLETETSTMIAEDPEADIHADHWQKVNAATRRGDTAEVERLREEYRQKMDELAEKRMQSLIAAHGGDIDAEVVELYRKYSDWISENPTIAYSATNTPPQVFLSLARKMGQVELDASGKPISGADRYNASGGWVEQEGLYLRISSLKLVDYMEGLPALVEWLCAQGCLDIHYRFGDPVPDSE